MANYLVTTMGSTGSVLPFLLLGDELRRRGHTVSFISNEKYRAQITRSGYDFDAIDSEQESGKFLSKLGLLNTPQGAIEIFREHIVPSVRRETELLSAKIRAQQHVVIMTRSQPGIGAQLVAERFGQPLVSVFSAPNFYDTIPIYEAFLTGNFLREINELRKSLELQEMRKWGVAAGVQRACIGFWPDWFAAGAENSNWPDLLRAGFALASEGLESNDRESLNVLDDTKSERPVIITPGTGPFFGSEFFSASIEGTLETGR